MTSLQISYFLAVAEQLSFSKAAQRLYVSQPAVSHQVAELEKELGVQLFERRKKNAMTLTEAGRIYRDTFLAANSELQRAGEAARRAQGARRSVLRICIPEEWDGAELAKLCAERAQGELSFAARDFRSMYDDLAAGRADIIVCAETTLRDPGAYSVYPLAHLPALALISPANPLYGECALKLSDLKKQPMLVLPESETPLFREVMLSEAVSWGFMPRIVEKQNRSTIALSLDMGEGWSVFDAMSRHLRRESYAAVRLGTGIPICAVTVMGRDNADGEAVIKTMREYLTEIGKRADREYNNGR